LSRFIHLDHPQSLTLKVALKREKFILRSLNVPVSGSRKLVRARVFLKFVGSPKPAMT